MSPRLRNWLFLIATALLYLGPLLAGLADYGWAVVPLFAVIFLAWLAIMRPGLWPVTASGWGSTGAWVALGWRAAVQIALVVFCFAIGRGIGGMLGALPPLSLWLTLGLSAVSVPLSFLFRPPPLTPEMAAMVAAATQDLHDNVAKATGTEGTPAAEGAPADEGEPADGKPAAPSSDGARRDGDDA